MFVSYLSNNRDVLGVLVLKKALDLRQSRVPFGCIVLEGVSKASLQKLKHNGIQLFPFHLGQYLHSRGFTADETTRCVQKHYFGKLFAFGLTQFDRVVYMDADVLVLQNIDHLLTLDMKGADVLMANDVMSRGKCIRVLSYMWNSGVMVLKPNLLIQEQCFEVLRDYVLRAKYTPLADQTVLNRMAEQEYLKVGNLPYRYNHIVSLFNFATAIPTTPVIVHFILSPKPWDIIAHQSPDFQRSMGPPVTSYFRRWLSVFIHLSCDGVESMNIPGFQAQRRQASWATSGQDSTEPLPKDFY